MTEKKLFGNSLLILTAMIWGLSFIFQRKGMDYIGPVTFCAVRMLISALCLGIMVLINDRKKAKLKNVPSAKLNKAEYIKFKKNTAAGGILCGICLFGAAVFQQMGLVYTTAGKAGFISAMGILIVPIISAIFLKTGITAKKWISVFAGAAAIYLLSMAENLSIGKGELYLILCAFFYAFHMICCDLFVGKSDPLRVSMLQFITCSLISFIFAFLFEAPTIEGILAAAVPLIYCSVFSGAIGYTLQILALKFTDPTSASLLLSFECLFSAILGVLFLHEHMSAREIAGGIILFMSIIFIQLPESNKKA